MSRALAAAAYWAPEAVFRPPLERLLPSAELLSSAAFAAWHAAPDLATMVAEQVTPLGMHLETTSAAVLQPPGLSRQLCSAFAGLQLPPTVHATLPESQLGEGRVIVIGDVHGCPGELQELLAK